jgi:hypothetical protein
MSIQDILSMDLDWIPQLARHASRIDLARQPVIHGPLFRYSLTCLIL